MTYSITLLLNCCKAINNLPQLLVEYPRTLSWANSLYFLYLWPSHTVSGEGPRHTVSREASFKLFSDYIKLYTSFDNSTQFSLQMTLNRIQKSSNDWQLKLNRSKSRHIRLDPVRDCSAFALRTSHWSIPEWTLVSTQALNAHFYDTKHQSRLSHSDAQPPSIACFIRETSLSSVKHMPHTVTWKRLSCLKSLTIKSIYDLEHVQRFCYQPNFHHPISVISFSYT